MWVEPGAALALHPAVLQPPPPPLHHGPPAAERALTAEDAELSSLVASVLQISSAREVGVGKPHKTPALLEAGRS